MKKHILTQRRHGATEDTGRLCAVAPLREKS